MDNFIFEAFEGVEFLDWPVQMGYYDLYKGRNWYTDCSPDRLISRADYENIIRPGDEVVMQLWDLSRRKDQLGHISSRYFKRKEKYKRRIREEGI